MTMIFDDENSQRFRIHCDGNARRCDHLVGKQTLFACCICGGFFFWEGVGECLEKSLRNVLFHIGKSLENLSRSSLTIERSQDIISHDFYPQFLGLFPRTWGRADFPHHRPWHFWLSSVHIHGDGLHSQDQDDLRNRRFPLRGSEETARFRESFFGTMSVTADFGHSIARTKFISMP